MRMKRMPEGRVVAVYRSADRALGVVKPAVDALDLTFDGVEQDCHGGRVVAANYRQRWLPEGTPVLNTRAVSLVSVEELANIARLMGVETLDASFLGANVLVEGILDLTRLVPGSRLLLGSSASVLVLGENLPCKAPDKAMCAAWGWDITQASLFSKAALGLRGVVGLVETEGRVVPGDRVLPVVPQQYVYRESLAAELE